MIGFCEVAARSLLLRVPISSVAGRRVWRGGSASGGAQLPLSLPDVAASYMFTLSADYRIIARYNSGRKAARGLGGEGGQGVWEAGRAGEERGRDVCRSGSHWGVFNFTERKFFNLFVSSLMMHSDRVKN